MKLFLRFPKEITDKPIISTMIREQGVEVNILYANISPREDGEMVMDIGEGAEIAVDWLKAMGILVVPLSEKITRNKERCVDCGSCAGVCPSGALSMKDDQIVFDHESCFFCLFCIDMCPTGSLEAME